MKYRVLGRTGLRISEIVFGAGAVGGLFIYADDETRRKAIRRVVESGINWIDTAPVYGDGGSEKAIGWLLDGVPEADRPHISTKVRIDRAAGDYRGQVERGIHESLARMNLEKVDLLQVHNGVSVDPDAVPTDALSVEDLLDENGMADALDMVREQGLTDFTGITATGEIDAIQKVAASERFDTAQVYYNLLNPSAGRPVPSAWSSDDYRQLIDECVEHGVGVLAFRLLAAGIIGSDVRHGRENPVGTRGDLAADEVRMRAVTPLLSDDLGSRGVVGIRYALSNPGVSGALVGIADLDQLEEAIHASELGPLPDSLMAELDRLADTDFGTLN